MKRASVLILAVVLLASCVTSAGVQRSPLEMAKLSYADASLTYEASMTTLVMLRAAHQLSDAQWKKVDEAQRVVRSVAPRLRSALDLWASSGAKPASYDAILKELTDAYSSVNGTLDEVKR